MVSQAIVFRLFRLFRLFRESDELNVNLSFLYRQEPSVYDKNVYCAGNNTEIIKSEYAVCLKTIIHSEKQKQMKTTYTLSEAAQELGIKGIGRNLIYQILRKLQIIDDYNMPDRKYLEEELFTYESPIRYADGFARQINVLLVVGEKGLNFIEQTVREYLRTNPKPRISRNKVSWMICTNDQDCRDI
ncbi:MAG: hypothetical protein QM301_12065 [Bacteroidota bacterium]|nr:hypothetical protein [Bacteroidota bacterium]